MHVLIFKNIFSKSVWNRLFRRIVKAKVSGSILYNLTKFNERILSDWNCTEIAQFIEHFHLTVNISGLIPDSGIFLRLICNYLTFHSKFSDIDFDWRENSFWIYFMRKSTCIWYWCEKWQLHHWLHFFATMEIYSCEK